MLVGFAFLVPAKRIVVGEGHRTDPRSASARFSATYGAPLHPARSRSDEPRWGGIGVGSLRSTSMLDDPRSGSGYTFDSDASR